MKKNCGYLKYYLIASGLIVILALNYIFTLSDGKLHVFFLDVGQGDATLIRSPDNSYILIDGGPDDSVLRGLGRVMPFYARTIDLVILTHPHPDHINGLIEVLKRYEVKSVLLTGINYDYAGYSEFINLLAQNGVKVIFATGRDFEFGGLDFDMIFPFDSIQGRRFENVNNSSIVFRMIDGECVFYFSGDAETLEEEAILAARGDIGANILKVGHHGSRTASGDTIVSLIHPDYAVISVGKDNKFNHPHAETIDTMQKHYVKILRTDILGAIEFESDGEKIRLSYSFD